MFYKRPVNELIPKLDQDLRMLDYARKAEEKIAGTPQAPLMRINIERRETIVQNMRNYILREEGVR